MKSKLIVPTSDCGDQFIREPKILDECPLFKTLEAKDQRIKELEDALGFALSALSSFFPFCGKDVSKLPTNLDASQYQTCSYDGDKKLLEKFIECRKLVTVEEE